MAPIAYTPFHFTGIPAVCCAFTSRLGGVSEPPHDGANLSYDVQDEAEAVSRNRTLLADRLGLQSWTECNQIHGDAMHFDPAPDAPEARATLDGDGLATARPGQALVIKTADCQPVLLAHADGRHVAALHVGWRGNLCDFPGSGVARFCEHYGLDPADIFAVRGPSLGPDAAEFVNFDTDFGPKFRNYFNEETRTMDLWRLTRDQLENAGLRPDRIFGVDLCTRTRCETYFSYRKACMDGNPVTGRQAGIIWIRG